MKILILSFYYKPDLCAGSFRNTALVEELKKKLTQFDSIDVITSMPNRYKSFKEEAPEKEKDGNISIHRIIIPPHKSGFADQIYSFKTFYLAAKKITAANQYDIVYASSSRLFTAFLGARIARKKKIPLFLDIRDIFVDTMNEVIKSKLVKLFFLPPLKIIEKYTINSASHLNLITEGFKEYFSYFKGKTTFYTNGIDNEFIGTLIKKDTGYNKKVIVYAGNFGQGQGLEKILPGAAEKLPEYEFRLFGDGNTKSLLEKEISIRKLNNLKIFNPVNREKLIDEYNKADYLFMHLNDYEAFKKVLPSKVFEFGASNKTVIAGVSGYARKFVETYITDSIVFEPCNVNKFVEEIKKHTPEKKIRHDFIEKFKRTVIMEKMANSIIEISNKN